MSKVCNAKAYTYVRSHERTHTHIYYQNSKLLSIIISKIIRVQMLLMASCFYSVNKFLPDSSWILQDMTQFVITTTHCRTLKSKCYFRFFYRMRKHCNESHKSWPFTCFSFPTTKHYGMTKIESKTLFIDF